MVLSMSVGIYPSIEAGLYASLRTDTSPNFRANEGIGLSSSGGCLPRNSLLIREDNGRISSSQSCSTSQSRPSVHCFPDKLGSRFLDGRCEGAGIPSTSLSSFTSVFAVPDDSLRTNSSRLQRHWRHRAGGATRAMIDIAVPGFQSDTRHRGGGLATSILVNKTELARSPEESERDGDHSLEKWVKNAIFDIVKNLHDAPFMHLVFDPKSPAARAGNCMTSTPSRRRVPEELFNEPARWQHLRESVLEDAPDGVILVHRLDIAESVKCYGGTTAEGKHDDAAASNSCQPSTALSADQNRHSFGTPAAAFVGSGTVSCSDLWGVVVQGNRCKRHACYILKTTRTPSPLGGACTRFTLTKARCFGPGLHRQLEESWLV